MKKIASLSLLLSFVVVALHAQKDSAQLPKQPVDWTFERFSLPSQFAPSIKYHGAEELRFSPGMFKKGTTDYYAEEKVL